MRVYPDPPDDLEQTVRWALRAAVARAEPSPTAWRVVRERIASAPVPRPRPLQRGRWLRPRPGLQALTLSLALAALLVAVNGNTLLPSTRPEVPCAKNESSRARQPLVGDTDDTLSGRLLWLASREPKPRDALYPRGYLE